MSEQEMTEETITQALENVCNTGPYILDFQKSNELFQVYRCQACGAELGQSMTATRGTWMHYKPESISQ